MSQSPLGTKDEPISGAAVDPIALTEATSSATRLPLPCCCFSWFPTAQVVVMERHCLLRGFQG